MLLAHLLELVQLEMELLTLFADGALTQPAHLSNE